MIVYDRRGIEITELKIETVRVMTKSSVLYLAIDGRPKVREEKEQRKGKQARRYICG